MEYATVGTFLTVLALVSYLIAIWRGVRYMRRQWGEGRPMPGWITLGGLFAVVVTGFLLYALVGRLRGAGPSVTTTTLSLLVYFMGGIVMNGLISLFGGGER